MLQQWNKMSKHRMADLIVLIGLMILVIIYCVDAVRASTNLLNLILVLPVTVIVLVLCLIQFFVSAPKTPSTTVVQDPLIDILPVIALFALYVVALPWLGFDIGTCLFLGSFLWMHGERRWVWLLGYSISFAFVLAIFFSKMLPYPMPMMVLRTGLG